MRNESGVGTKLANFVLAMLQANGPKIGRRYLLGQERCTVWPKYGRCGADRSEAMNAQRGKYMPHQGEREKVRRIRQMERAQ